MIDVGARPNSSLRSFHRLVLLIFFSPGFDRARKVSKVCTTFLRVSSDSQLLSTSTEYSECFNLAKEIRKLTNKKIQFVE